MVKTNEPDTINIGIFGHIDHGKTTLLEKLSGKWADTHSEELKRGITIKLGYADATIYDDSGKLNIDRKGKSLRHVSFIDAPGHEMLMATMLSGAALIDAAILVIAANEGIKPQTREHFMALRAKNIKNLIIVQNKIDLVEKQQAIKNHEEILNLLGKDYKNSPIIPVSAQQNVNIQELFKQIIALPSPQRNDSDVPVFIVARSFDINRPGTFPKDLHGAVLGGSLKKGIISIGDEIEISPGIKTKEGDIVKYKKIKTKVLSIYKGSEKVNPLTPGGSISIETSLDMSLGKADSLAGNVVSLAGKLPEPTNTVKLKYTLFEEVFGIGRNIKIEPIKPNEILMLSVNTSITGGTVSAITKDNCTFSLKVPVVLFKGDNVGIARNIHGHWRLIGYAEVI